MRHYECPCGNVLFFDNSTCVQCATEVGYDVASDQMVTLDGAASFKRCADGMQYGVCNWVLPVGDVDTLCPSCQLNRTIPDLASAANHEPWHKLEIAKRRILYTLARLGLSPLNKKQDAVSGLAFDFLRPNPGGLVLTGHEDGVITLNVEEAEDLERGKRRVLLGESYRTLVGHFRHEIAHYYWDRFFIGRTDGDVGMQGFREGFGDERDDYNLALQRHYTAGPVAA